jgi:hypothetical protein
VHDHGDPPRSGERPPDPDRRRCEMRVQTTCSIVSIGSS